MIVKHMEDFEAEKEQRLNETNQKDEKSEPWRKVLYVHDIINLDEFQCVTGLYSAHYKGLRSLGILQVAFTPEERRINVIQKDLLYVILDFIAETYKDIKYMGKQKNFSVKRWYNTKNPYINFGIVPLEPNEVI
ncbi:MAG: hypothetical protein ACTSYR_04935 [Candidatus Odinarchaeia archaeon]